MIKFFRNLVKYFFLIAIVTIVTTVIMYAAVIRSFEPLYESKASLLVNRHSEISGPYEAYVMLQEVQISEMFVNEIPEMIFSVQVRQKVNQALEEEFNDLNVYDERTFQKSVETEIVRDSRIINIYVRHSDPERAKLVAETIAWNVDILMMDIIGQDFIQVINWPDKPKFTVGLRTEHLWLLSVAGGFILGIGLVFLITLSDQYPVKPFNLKFFSLSDFVLLLKGNKKK